MLKPLQTRTSAVSFSNKMIKEIAFTAYPVKDIKKARKFYEDILGLKASSDFNSGSWIEYSIGKSTLAIGCMEGWEPSAGGGSIALEVKGIEKFVSMLKDNKVHIALDTQIFPNCSMAIIRDIDGNSIILHEMIKKQ